MAIAFPDLLGTFFDGLGVSSNYNQSGPKSEFSVSMNLPLVGPSSKRNHNICPSANTVNQLDEINSELNHRDNYFQIPLNCERYCCPQDVIKGLPTKIHFKQVRELNVRKKLKIQKNIGDQSMDGEDSKQERRKDSTVFYVQQVSINKRKTKREWKVSQENTGMGLMIHIG